MARIHKRHTLKELYHRKELFTQSLSLIDKDAAYRTIQTFLRRKHFNMSLGSIGNLVKKVKRARNTGTPIAKVMDKRAYSQHKKTLADVKKQGRLHMPKTDPTTSKIVNNSLKKAKEENNDNVSVTPMGFHISNRQVLDKQIDEYYSELQAHDCEKDVRQAGLKAIELEDRYPGEGALSLSAIKQYQLITNAESKAIAQVIYTMLPPKQVAKFNSQYDRVLKSLLASVDLSPEGKKLYAKLDKDGVKVDD